MRALRVLEMIDRPFLGGGQVVLLSLAKGLDRERFAVAVCARDGGPLADEVRRLGLPFHPANFEKKPSRGLADDLARILRENKVDILHTHGGIAGLFGRWAAKKAETPVVVHTLHGIHYLHYRNPILRRLSIGLERRSSKFTDTLVCVSEADRAQALKLRLADETKIRLISNGVEGYLVPETPDGERRLLELRIRLRLEPPVVGTVARLHRQKGVVYFLRAAAAIRRSHPAAKIVVVGGGPLETKFRKMLRKGRFGRSVVLFGERTDAAEILTLFDIFVLPSLWEGLPLALVEAAAAGKSIVATDIDGVREVIRDGETGLLVPPKNPGALAAAVGRLLDDRTLAQRLAARALAEIPSRFTLDRMVSEYAALYLELAALKRL
jgi:glycosyltransferase involved in cell wall biosynthesis